MEISIFGRVKRDLSATKRGNVAVKGFFVCIAPILIPANGFLCIYFVVYHPPMLLGMMKSSRMVFVRTFFPELPVLLREWFQP
jgi:hypothetical protein